MRQAVRRAFREITGHDPEYLFTGWVGSFSASEQEYINTDHKGSQRDGLQVLTVVMEKLLTQVEVDALPTGTEVWIVWDGGNGPHRYRIRNEGGEAHVDQQISSGDTRIDFVGKEQYHCHVWLVDAASKGNSTP